MRSVPSGCAKAHVAPFRGTEGAPSGGASQRDDRQVRPTRRHADAEREFHARPPADRRLRPGVRLALEVQYLEVACTFPSSR